MKLDLINLLGNNGAVMPFKVEIVSKPVKFQGGEYGFAKPINVQGDIKNIGGSIEVEAKIEGALKTACARCTEDVTYNFKTNLRERIKNDEDDAVKLEGSILDLEPVVLNTVMMQLPMRFLCRDDCKGLCHMCGKNLNNEGCDCTDTEEDPRFNVLKNLILKDEV